MGKTLNNDYIEETYNVVLDKEDTGQDQEQDPGQDPPPVPDDPNPKRLHFFV